MKIKSLEEIYLYSLPIKVRVISAFMVVLHVFCKFPLLKYYCVHSCQIASFVSLMFSVIEILNQGKITKVAVLGCRTAILFRIFIGCDFFFSLCRSLRSLTSSWVLVWRMRCWKLCLSRSRPGLVSAQGSRCVSVKQVLLCSRLMSKPTCPPWTTGLCCHWRLQRSCGSWGEMLQRGCHSHPWSHHPGQAVNRPRQERLLG